MERPTTADSPTITLLPGAKPPAPPPSSPPPSPAARGAVGLLVLVLALSTGAQLALGELEPAVRAVLCPPAGGGAGVPAVASAAPSPPPSSNGSGTASGGGAP